MLQPSPGIIGIPLYTMGPETGPDMLVDMGIGTDEPQLPEAQPPPLGIAPEAQLPPAQPELGIIIGEPPSTGIEPEIGPPLKPPSLQQGSQPQSFKGTSQQSWRPPRLRRSPLARRFRLLRRGDEESQYPSSSIDELRELLAQVSYELLRE